ncbi:hypothetical protein [Rhabdaerophilum sp. SD176]|uniref:hypothetical protein n=1 Tax=Rhabdaerophilum sp. SD176 TaxID=2983548 RepID=UPI0024DF9317|nr:hypothetical protein [Rhabdaerophilum sp. SD176]
MTINPPKTPDEKDTHHLTHEDRHLYAAHDQSRYNPSPEKAAAALNKATRDAKTVDASRDPELCRQIETYAIDAAIRLLFWPVASEAECRVKYSSLLGAPFLPGTSLMLHLIAGALRHDSERLGVKIELKTIAPTLN